MEIKTKYNIGDKVWVVKEADYYNSNTRRRELAGTIEVFDDYIDSIQLYNAEDEVIYVLKNADMLELFDHDIILYNEKDKLLEKIEQVMNEIHKRESEGK